MSVYFLIQNGTEAHQKYEAYYERLGNGFERVNALLDQHFGLTTDKMFHSDGSIVGFGLPRQPDGWVNSSRGGFMPKRIKSHMPFIKALAAIEVPSGGGLTKDLFGNCPLYFRGMSMCRGVGAQRIGERIVIEFVDADQVALFREECRWPKGLRQVKASTVEHWNEQVAA
jgi:hypothetical protein